MTEFPRWKRRLFISLGYVHMTDFFQAVSVANNHKNCVAASSHCYQWECRLYWTVNYGVEKSEMQNGANLHPKPQRKPPMQSDNLRQNSESITSYFCCGLSNGYFQQYNTLCEHTLSNRILIVEDHDSYHAARLCPTFNTS